MLSFERQMNMGLYISIFMLRKATCYCRMLNFDPLYQSTRTVISIEIQTPGYKRFSVCLG
jgi:hypothetical protein